ALILHSLWPQNRERPNRLILIMISRSDERKRLKIRILIFRADQNMNPFSVDELGQNSNNFALLLQGLQQVAGHRAVGKFRIVDDLGSSRDKNAVVFALILQSLFAQQDGSLEQNVILDLLLAT